MKLHDTETQKPRERNKGKSQSGEREDDIAHSANSNHCVGVCLSVLLKPKIFQKLRNNSGAQYDNNDIDILNRKSDSSIIKTTKKKQQSPVMKQKYLTGWKRNGISSSEIHEFDWKNPRYLQIGLLAEKENIHHAKRERKKRTLGGNGYRILCPPNELNKVQCFDRYFNLYLTLKNNNGQTIVPTLNRDRRENDYLQFLTANTFAKNPDMDYNYDSYSYNNIV